MAINENNANNTNLLGAQAHPDDEFYTPLEMIERELSHYDKNLFAGKKILCNCDDPGESSGDRRMSAFFEYFENNFDELGLEQLVGIRYSGSTLYKKIRGSAAYTRTVAKSKKGKKQVTVKRNLIGDSGGFNDTEGKKQLKNCDIVVTNPPFSKFLEFFDMLIKSKKRFIIIGNLNAAGYSDIFPHINAGRMSISARCKGEFIRPDGRNKNTAASFWYTNMKHSRSRPEIELTAQYTAKDYPSYDNYPAIEVGRVRNIPKNYWGDMGVPITFLEKHNPKQFEIVRFRKGGDGRDLKIGGRIPYLRLIIRRVQGDAGWKETRDLTSISVFGDAGGFIYIATKKGEDGYKIGKTHGSVADRVFTKDAFSRERPKVYMALEVVNANIAEKQIHDALNLYRTQGTEFFNVPKKSLEDALSHIAKKPIKLWRKPIEAKKKG